MTRCTCNPEPNGTCENCFVAQVIAYAKLRGWRVHHQRPARTADGDWRTAVQGDAGFPDLVLVRLSRVIFVELKAEKGRVSVMQQLWLDALENTGKVSVHLWRPSAWPAIEEALK